VSASAGNPLFEELLHIHGLIRADLAKVELLAEDCAGGAAPAELQARIADLKSSSLLWQLKLGCLRHCRFVHGHHGLEDRAVFPSVRRVAPELGPAIDRLERDHREVANLLAAVERAALEVDVAGGRGRLVAALTELSALLLDHLDREERDLEPALARMHSWLG
jgi:hemerythrin HHE cation binding domain-containing protein